MGVQIHPTAIVDASAKLGENVRIGAFTLVGAGVEIGDGCDIGSHCSLHGPTRIGRDNRIIGHAVIGGDPQDKKYNGERTELVIGNGNLIREFVTINRGTGGGGGITTVGNDNWFLAYVHIAHDCHVGDNCVFSNNTTLAGHVSIGDWVILSGFAGATQFCRIGAHAFLGKNVTISADVPPFTMIAGDEHGRPRGINSEGLKRRGFDTDRIAAIKRAYRTLYMAGLPLAEARQQLAEQARDNADVKFLLDFIESGDRPLLR
jgi:UDP-N-acetylglucosamine acyltransferase